MCSSRLFWKLFAAYAGLILAAAAVSAALIAALEREQVLNYIEDRLHDDAVMLRSQVAYGLGQNHQDGLQALTLRLARETKTRITIVASDGVVLADSEQDPAQMENHLDRQEIALAAASGTGKCTHVSRTLGIPMRYFALRVDEAGRPVGFVRIALPLQTVEARISTVQRLIWSIAGVVALATLAMTYLVAARIIRPLTNLRSAAQAIADGDYGQRVVVSSHDELGLLSDAFNRMGVELAFRINRMHENQELLATVLAGMIEGVVAVDSKERVLFTNAAAQELLGLVQENLTGRPLWELVRHGTVQQTVRDALRSDQPCRCELEITSPNRRVVSLHARRLPGDPSPGAVLVFHDSTDLRRLESLRRDFMANVSHELKTPLSSIMAYAETLLNGAMNDQDSNVGFVRQIEEQA